MRKSGIALFGLGVLLTAGLAQRAEAQYCSASSGYTPCNAIYEYISNVQLGSINNSSDCSAPAYEDYTGVSTSLAPGQSMPISVTIGTPFTLDECTVWIDWDNNGSFDDSEAVPLTFNPYPVFTGTISVPINTTVGAKRMRVRLTYDITPVACGDSGPYGNIEDYTINVTNPGDPLIAGNPAVGAIGAPLLLTANVIPGQNPDSTSLTVTGDLSSIGGPSSQAFYDDGTHGDTAAGDHVYSYMYAVPHAPALSPGNFGVPLTVVDNLNRSSTGNLSVTLTAEPIGGCCTGGTCSVATSFNCAGGGGHYLGDNTNCQGGPNHNYTSDPNLAIPDAGPPVSDTINVSDTFTVAQVTVRVTIPDHTFIGDLTVDISNSVNTVRLWNRQCGGDNGLDVTFDDNGAAVVCAEPTVGTYAPASPLNLLNGGSANGPWTLTVQDNAGIDVGTLTHWEINLHEPVSCGPVCGSADFNCDGDVGTDQDIEGFFACLAGTCPAAPCTNSADFNGDGDVGTDQDIEAFFRVLAGGNC